MAVLRADADRICVLAIGRNDGEQAAIAAALAGTSFELIQVNDIHEAATHVAEQQIDALVVDLEHASTDGSFDLVELMGLFLWLPSVVVLESYEPQAAVELVRFGAQEVLQRNDLSRRLSAALECAMSRAHVAHYDNLTGLPNRSLLYDRLAHAIKQAGRYGHQLAVLFIDLDRFKFVNDTMGHEAGDVLLKTVAGRIRDCLRVSDTVARLGGDEFIAIIANLEDGMAAARIASKLIENLSAPVEIGGHVVSVSPSIGIALFPSDAESGDELIRLADVAMYQAKQTGGSAYQFYRPDLNSDALRRIGLGVALQRAIRNGELELHYQPQLDVVAGNIVGLEALVRWRHPDRGLIPPDQFIPLAEELGLMVPMGDWILQDACEQLRSWFDQGLPRVRVAINLSAHQFNRESLQEHVLKWIEQAGLQAADVELELTESSVMRDPDATAKVLHSLNEAGVGLAIDDFGTGYSSLAYLKRFPLDVLKIDRSFVRDVTTDENDAAIVKTIIGLARHFNLRVVGEGVESVEHLDFLKANGCRYVQGFHIARPVPADQVPALLQESYAHHAGPDRRSQPGLRYAVEREPRPGAPLRWREALKRRWS